MLKMFNIELEMGGFNRVQKELLRALYRAKAPLSIRALEEQTGEERLTVYYNLKRLRERRRVRQDRTGKIYTWSLVPTEASDAHQIPIARAYDVIARSPSQRLWGIQGGEAVRTLIKEIDCGATYRPIHHRQRLRKVVVDAILTEKGVALVRRAPETELISHLRRPTILYITADTPELDHREIMTDGKTLLTIDHAKGTATVLHDAEAAAAYIALHETIKRLSIKARPQEIYGDL